MNYLLNLRIVESSNSWVLKLCWSPWILKSLYAWISLIYACLQDIFFPYKLRTTPVFYILLQKEKRRNVRWKIISDKKIALSYCHVKILQGMPIGKCPLIYPSTAGSSLSTNELCKFHNINGWDAKLWQSNNAGVILRDDCAKLLSSKAGAQMWFNAYASGLTNRTIITRDTS